MTQRAIKTMLGAAAFAVTGLVSLPVLAQVGPVVSIGNPVTFDADNELWRDRSVTGGFVINVDYGPAIFDGAEGQPPGSVVVTDNDNQWQELVSPDLISGTDHSFFNGCTITFDYNASDAIQYDIYVAIEGNNGDRYFHIFGNQVTGNGVWDTVSVDFNASDWLVGFDGNTGPIGPAPAESDFQNVLADLDHIAFSMEGQNGPDTTYFDNLMLTCPPPPPPPPPGGGGLSKAVPVSSPLGLALLALVMSILGLRRR